MSVLAASTATGTAAGCGLSATTTTPDGTRTGCLVCHASSALPASGVCADCHGTSPHPDLTAAHTATVTSATITTRLLTTDREKTIATTILQFAIPCSAQLAVIAALLTGAGVPAMILYIVVIFAVLVTIGTILNKVLKGESTPLLIDLPPMRMPRLRNVLRKTSIRTYHFMKEASGWFFVGALAVGVAQSVGLLKYLVQLLTPLTTSWLKLPAEASKAFIMGVVRRDFGAAGLYEMSLSPMQVAVALIVITLFVPCIASLMVMMKERGWREGFVIWIGTWIAAFAVGGLVSQLVI